MLHSKGRPHEEKLLFFWILPYYLPPSPSPQFGQLVQLFSDVKIYDLKVSLELKIQKNSSFSPETVPYYIVC